MKIQLGSIAANRELELLQKIKTGGQENYLYDDYEYVARKDLEAYGLIKSVLLGLGKGYAYELTEAGETYLKEMTHDKNPSA